MSRFEEKTEGAPRFRSRPIEVSLYETEEQVGYNPVFEGQTSSISRQGVGVRVNPRGGYKRVKPRDLMDKEFVVQFHTGAKNVPNASGVCTMVGESKDMRYKLYMGFEFEKELPLIKLIA
ncbi:MAG: hypothetical protein ACLFN5_07190 [bacterium]